MIADGQLKGKGPKDEIASQRFLVVWKCLQSAAVNLLGGKVVCLTALGG